MKINVDFDSVSELSALQLDLENRNRIGQPFIDKNGNEIRGSITVGPSTYIRSIGANKYRLSDCLPINCPVHNPDCGYILTGDQINLIARSIKSRM